MFAFFFISSTCYASEAPDYWGYTLRSLGSLILVLGVIVLFFYIIKKISRGGGVSSSRIKIKNRLYLDNKRYLAVIEVDGREFLIGASDSINILMELKNDDKED
ncbi:FliO/MopB family protein [Hippea sp. KM1]|uniref:FliO/MopB family protein n=1 Tax=Hippea sp. KM1 TaxID=944481 RepID=UPI0018DE06C7|nr:flagellar biosynthetic protein FliO [Hippea sp. KM1]